MHRLPLLQSHKIRARRVVSLGIQFPLLLWCLWDVGTITSGSEVWLPGQHCSLQRWSRPRNAGVSSYTAGSSKEQKGPSFWLQQFKNRNILLQYWKRQSHVFSTATWSIQRLQCSVQITSVFLCNFSICIYMHIHTVSRLNLVRPNF